MLTVLKTFLGKNSQLGHAGSFTIQINNLKKTQKTKTPKNKTTTAKTDRPPSSISFLVTVDI